MLPIANTREGFEQMAGTALDELARRTRLFDQAEGMVDNLDEYNAAAVEPLAPVLVVFDEFSSVVQGMGGSAWEIRKGCHRTGLARAEIWPASCTCGAGFQQGDYRSGAGADANAGEFPRGDGGHFGCGDWAARGGGAALAGGGR
jgi:hypothetical protein